MPHKTPTALLAAVALTQAADADPSPIAEALALDPERPPLSATLLPIPDLDVFASNFGEALVVQGEYAFAGTPFGFPESSSFGTEDDESPGVVHVYRRSGGIWSIIQALGPPDAAAEFGFGVSLDVSADGQTLVVGCNDARQEGNAAPLQGGAYVFTLDPASGRFRYSQKLTRPGSLPLERQGFSVAISGDWIAVGEPAPDSARPGSVHLYQRASGGPWSFSQSLRPSYVGASHEFGREIAMDGPDLAVAAPGYDFGDGRVTLYRLAGSSWNEDAFFDAPDSDVSEFGNRLALSDGRLWAAVRFSSSGSNRANTYYDRSGGSWVQGPPLVPQTFSLGPGRLGLDVRGDIAVTDGVGGSDGPPTSTNDDFTLGEVFVLEGGSYTSKLVLGDLVGGIPVPSGTEDPWRDQFGLGEVSTDGTTILFDFFPVDSSGGFSVNYLCAITPGAPPDPVAAIRAALFYGDAQDAGDDPQDAAFAYETLMYGTNIPNFDLDAPGSELYGPTQRAKADEAEARIRLAYPTAGEETRAQLEELFLDLAYGRAAAELILARETLDRIDRDRIEGVPSIPGDVFFLDSEIARIRDAFDHTEAAVGVYLDLFADSLGAPPREGITTGRRIFAERTPGRPLQAPQDALGNPVNGSGADLLPSHKDLVLASDILLEHARTASRLAYLLTAKGDAASATEVRALIGDVTRLLFEQRVLVDDLFPELNEPARDALGLSELAGSADVVLSELAAFAQNLDGTINLFGYEPDFLFLINGSAEGIFNSFDNFKARLAPANPDSVLKKALDTRQEAESYLDTYLYNIDTLDAEWLRIADVGNGAIIPRLIEIAGVEPPPTLPADPAHPYANPGDNPGSDIDLQTQAIEVARLRIERNGTEIANLRSEIQIEIQRRAVERGINASLSDLIIDFGNQQASLTQEIGRIEAAQAASGALAEGLEIEKLNPIDAYFTAVNAAVQAGGEIDKANREASKERLAATQEAAIRDADDQILGNNSRAFIRTRLLEMNTLSIDSQEAVLLLRQEVGRYVALVGEKEDLERRLIEARQRLSSRYAADPVHRLRAVREQILAQTRFQQARNWLFFMARALEYKWNIPFSAGPGVLAAPPAPDAAWDVGDLFKMRNAFELELFYDAMVAFDTSRTINRETLVISDRFSVREDFFGFFEEGFDETGTLVPLSYDVVNPDTGVLETGLDAITAFRHELRRATSPGGEIALRFDTVRRNGFETDSTGIENFTGNLFDPENYIDRIVTVQVFIPGPHGSLSGSNALNTVDVDVTYAGTTFFRSPSLSTSGDGSDLQPNELVSYPALLFLSKDFTVTYEDTSTVTINKFVGQDGLPQRTAKAVKLPTGTPLDEPLANSLREGPQAISLHSISTFNERAVATTSWLVELQELDTTNSQSRLQIDEMDDIILWIRHRSVQRGN